MSVTTRTKVSPLQSGKQWPFDAAGHPKISRRYKKIESLKKKKQNYPAFFTEEQKLEMKTTAIIKNS